ncbi:DUF2188 domain-containing protein [Amycolatopsis sp. NPDC050768]|uniref:DUF2188 domain-containing protein n=1 Tax=Amycolatopsis sp. NPDC050768 TaxID=3154839 RepID=UPI00340525D5
MSAVVAALREHPHVDTETVITLVRADLPTVPHQAFCDVLRAMYFSAARTQYLHPGTCDAAGGGYPGPTGQREEARLMDGDVETFHENGLWKNKIDGYQRASNTFKDRAIAVKTGRHMAKARRVAHRVRDELGSLVSHEDYRTHHKGIRVERGS